MGRTFLPLLLALAVPLFSCEGGGQNGYLEQKAKRMAEQEENRQSKLSGADSLTPEKSERANGYLEARIRRQAEQDSAFARRKQESFERAHEVNGDTVVRKPSAYEEARLRRLKEQEERKRELDW